MRKRDQRCTVVIADEETSPFLHARPFIESDLQVDLQTLNKGEELLRYLESIEGQLPSLLVLDLNLSFSYGREALREIREHPSLKKIPVIAITNSDDEVQAAFELGANSYISKPCSPLELIDMFRSVQEFWLGTVRPR